jgi:enediyne biosynthesis protein E4
MAKNYTKSFFLFLLWSAFVFSKCRPEEKTLFTKLSADDSGIVFVNQIEETPAINILTYEYTYNGGGVAAADFNNDGLCDLYFSGNAVSNRLYINKGNLYFEDVTNTSGTGGRDLWKTGVSAADVNGDGWLDIYLCYSGPDSTYNLANQLFINNADSVGGTPTFTESAAKYNIDAAGTFSTQSAFFDYDLDGDLDMFLLNHGNHFYSPFVNTNRLRNTRHPQFGNRLFRNEMISDRNPGNHFAEVSAEAGIHGGGINFGLGISVSDVNGDDWPDIFVTNDYEEQDFLYLNNRDGTFRDATKKSFGHLSRNGMGTDISDFNNDGRPDLIEVDMWPEDNLRQKLLKGPDDYHRYRLMLDSGFHHQQMRNTLQLNAGTDAEGNPLFCEIGQIAGISATDWSWAPLFSDIDNDGWRDLFVSNGYLRDFTSMDFLKYTVEEERRKAKEAGTELELYKLVGKMPSTKTRDYVFRNNQNLTFTDITSEAGMNVPNLSFGATYADLDNDGDQELILNNTNETATVWVNHAREINGRAYIKVQLKGPKGNPFGIGAKVTLKSKDLTQTQEQYLTRGFQSSVDPVMHFGVGDALVADVIVRWPDGKITEVTDAPVNSRLVVDYSKGISKTVPSISLGRPRIIDVTDLTEAFVHRENIYHDYDFEPLLPYMLSQVGPPLAKGDLNDDGLDDFFIGGASGQSGRLFMGRDDGKFKGSAITHSEEGLKSDDTGAVFFDADSDGDLDLFVVRGGNEFVTGSAELDDRLYLNDGTGKFTNAPAGSIVADHSNGSCVTPADYDRDGDLDLFVGGTVQPGDFPEASPGAILRNDSEKNGKVKFTVVTREINPELRQPGMVTDAVWADVNQDTWPDLLVAGEWMPIRIFENIRGKLRELKVAGLEKSSGLWQKVEPADLDGDGDTDFVLGNAGMNLPWKVSSDHPLTLYHSDFNTDGKTDAVICHYTDDKLYPIASRDELLLQINTLRKKFTTYSAFGLATIEQIFDSNQLGRAKKRYVHTLESSILVNLGGGEFMLKPLPLEAQLSSVKGITVTDFTDDGMLDLVMAGNYFSYRTQFGPSDASLGVVLAGDGKGNFTPKPYVDSGLVIPGDVRSMILLKGTNRYLAVGRNNEHMSIYQIKSSPPDQISKNK